MIAAECQLDVGPIRFDLFGKDVMLRYDRWPYRDFMNPSCEANAAGVHTVEHFASPLAGNGRDACLPEARRRQGARPSKNSASERFEHWRDDLRLPVGQTGVVRGGASVSVTLKVRVRSGTEALPVTQPLYAAGSNWAVWKTPDGWVFASGYAARGHDRVHCRLRADFSRADLSVAPDAHAPPLRYPLDQILADVLLGRCGGVLLHAAAVERDGSGWVLAGRSGAGKSTLSALCHDQGWEILNDDRVIVYPDADGSWRVAGTPWHGSGAFAQNRSAPLRGIMLLHQAPRNRGEPLSLRQARLSLLEVAAIPWFEADWSQASLDALEHLTEQVPTRRFHFTRSERAVQTLAKKI